MGRYRPIQARVLVERRGFHQAVGNRRLQVAVGIGQPGRHQQIGFAAPQSAIDIGMVALDHLHRMPEALEHLLHHGRAGGIETEVDLPHHQRFGLGLGMGWRGAGQPDRQQEQCGRRFHLGYSPRVCFKAARPSR
ncbi:hypothetical protein D9M68_819010 [compost metagenome]